MARMIFIQVPEFGDKLLSKADSIVEYLALLMKLSVKNIGEPGSKKIRIKRDLLKNNSENQHICDHISDALIKFAETDDYRSAAEKDNAVDKMLRDRDAKTALVTTAKSVLLNLQRGTNIDTIKTVFQDSISSAQVDQIVGYYKSLSEDDKNLPLEEIIKNFINYAQP